MNQSVRPMVNTACVTREIPWVCFSRMIFSACGTQQSVVHTAARLPMYSTQTAMIAKPVPELIGFAEILQSSRLEIGAGQDPSHSIRIGSHRRNGTPKPRVKAIIKLKAAKHGADGRRFYFAGRDIFFGEQRSGIWHLRKWRPAIMTFSMPYDFTSHH